MADNQEQSPSGSPPASRLSGKRLTLIIAAVAAGLALLYGMMAGGGKRASRDAAASCAASTVAAAKVDPLAVDTLAALAVNKQPRLATNISFQSPEGKKLTLKEFLGKTVLLNLWATWCVPCRAEMPALDRLQKALGGKTFEVVAVNIDTSRLERRKPFLDSVGVKHLRFYADPKADSFQVLKQAGKVIGLPTTFLIGVDGCEIGRMAGPAEWDSDRAKHLIRAAIGG